MRTKPTILFRMGRAAFVTAVSIVCCTQLAARAENGHWTTTWATATEDIRSGFWMADGHFPPKPLAHDTLRMFMRASIGGELIRVRFSNAFGTDPVTLKKAHIAMAANDNSSAGDGDINTAADTVLTFRGAPSVVIPPGGEVYSDPVKFTLPDLGVVAVSIQYGEISDDPITGHRGARTTSFFADGNAVSAADMSGAVEKDVWYTCTGIEVMASVAGKTIVAMGDSITDGNGTLYNYHTRWTDFLAARLSTNAPTEDVGMANMGIGGSGSGMSVDRFHRDVLQQSAARWVIIFIGVNDIVYGSSPISAAIIANYTEMAGLAHAQGMKVYGATITPMGGNTTTAKEAVRQEVNAWIKTTAISEGIYDGFLDFDAVARDPGNPTYLQPAYAKDDLHLNVTGYEALADSIDLNLFVDP